MEQNYSKISFRQMGIKALLALVLFFSAATVSNASTRSDYHENDVTIESRGVVNGEIIFTLKYDNNEAEVLEIAITDRAGNRLYRKMFTEKKLNTMFKIPSELGTVYVTVTNTTNKTQKRFQVSATERMVEKVVIGSVR